MSDIEILPPCGMPAPEFALKRTKWRGLANEALLTSALNHHYFGLALLGVNVKTHLPGWFHMIAAQ